MLFSKQVVTHHFANIGNLSIQSNLFNQESAQIKHYLTNFPEKDAH